MSGGNVSTHCGSTLSMSLANCTMETNPYWFCWNIFRCDVFDHCGCTFWMARSGGNNDTTSSKTIEALCILFSKYSLVEQLRSDNELLFGPDNLWRVMESNMCITFLPPFHLVSLLYFLLLMWYKVCQKAIKLVPFKPLAGHLYRHAWQVDWRER